MTSNAFQPFRTKASLPPLAGERTPLHLHYVPDFKSRSKSRATSHNLEFLSKVFASEGASRFFKTFLLRFLFDTGKKQPSEDSFTMTLLAMTA